MTFVDEILRQSAAAFADIDRVRLTLADAGATARQWASDAGAVDEDGEPALGELLRSRYTMQSEREVYDLFKADHGGTPAAASPTMIGDVDDFFF